MSSRYCKVRRVSRLHKLQRRLITAAMRFSMTRNLAVEQRRILRWQTSQRGANRGHIIFFHDVPSLETWKWLSALYDVWRR